MNRPMLITLRILLCLLSLQNLAAATDRDMADAVVICDDKLGLCRYADGQTRRDRLPGRFERAMPFAEGLAAVRINGRFGYVDHRGEVVIAPQFDLAGNFHHGLAEILVGNKIGVINRRGDIVVQPMFRRAIPLTSDVVLAEEGDWMSGYYLGSEQCEPISSRVSAVDRPSAGSREVGDPTICGSLRPPRSSIVTSEFPTGAKAGLPARRRTTWRSTATARMT
jgi:hypothetical protein